MKEIIALLATELDDKHVTRDAIRKWDERGSVPYRHRLPLMELARRKRVALSAQDFEFTPKPERAA